MAPQMQMQPPQPPMQDSIPHRKTLGKPVNFSAPASQSIQKSSAAVVTTEEQKGSPGKLPSFRNVIKLQTTAGNWSGNSRTILASCLEEGESFEDADVMEALSQV